MLRKFLLLLTTVALIAGMVFTGLQLAPLMASIEFNDPGDRFERPERRYTVTANADEGGKIEGVKADYAKGELATLMAVADEGYIFNGWYSNNGSCKATSTTYSFNIEKNTELTAKFVLAPESMEGEFVFATEYTDCSDDFTFPVYCDRPDAETYLTEALSIVDADLLGTEYEELGTVPFGISRIGNTNEFSVFPIAVTLQSLDGDAKAATAKYRKGTTYTVVLDDGAEVSFAGGTDTLTFTIAGDKSSNVSYSEGIVNLDKNDIEIYDEYIVTNYPFVGGEVVCIYAELDENDKPKLAGSKFITVTSVDGERAYYTTPDLESVYETLEVFYKDQLDLESLGIDFAEDLDDQLRTAILTDESFAYSVAHAQQVLSDVAQRNGYTVELISRENVFENIEFDIRARKRANTIELDVRVLCNTPIFDESGKEAAVFVLDFEIEESIVLTPNVSLKLRGDVGNGKIKSYNIGIGVSVTEESEVSFSFNYDGNDTMRALERDFTSEIKRAITEEKSVFEKTKEVLESSVSGSELNADISVFRSIVPVSIENFTMNFDIKLCLDLNVTAALEYSSTAKSYFEVGVRSSGKGPQYYERKGASATCSDLIVSGVADVQFGIKSSFDFALTGLEELMNAQFEAEIGTYASVGGYANVNRGHAAAYLEIGSCQKLDYAYSIFDDQAELTDSEAVRSPILSYGYKNAIIGYINNESIEKGKGFSIIEEETDISDILYLYLAALDLETLELSGIALDPDSKDYTIQVKLSPKSNLVYANGKLRLKNKAPSFFEEKITITLKAKDSKWSKLSEDKVYVSVPTITIPVVFGDEDAYYDSIDTNIQKQFRRIYRSYNKANADALRGGFEELIESFVKIPEDQTALYHDFTSAYLGQLFDLIDEYRREEDNKRTMENKFVYQEANIFDDAVALISELMQGEAIEEDEGRDRIYELLEKAEGTVALYNTLIEVQDNEALKKQLSDSIGPKTNERIEKEIDDYAAQKVGNDRALALVEAARNLFGFND